MLALTHIIKTTRRRSLCTWPIAIFVAAFFAVVFAGNGSFNAADAQSKQGDKVELLRVILRSSEHNLPASDLAEDCSFSADGELLAACCRHWDAPSDDWIVSIRVWETKNGHIRTTRKFGGGDVYLGPMVFLRDGKEIVSSSSLQTDEGFNGLVQVWDLASGIEKQRIEIKKKAVGPIAVSADSRLLAIGSEAPEAEIVIWDVANGKCVTRFKGNGERVESIAFSPDGKLLVSSGVDGVVRVRDVATWKAVRELALRRDLTTFAISPSVNDRILAIANGDDELVLWNYATGDRVRKLVGQTQPIASMVFSSDGRQLISGGSPTLHFSSGKATEALMRADKSAQVLVWDVRSGKILSSVPSHVGEVRGLAYSPTDSMFATTDLATGALRLWKYHGEGAIGDKQRDKTQK